MTDRDPEAKPPEGRRFLDDQRNVDKLFYALCTSCAGLSIADFFYDKHGHFGFDQIPGFHALYGLGGCVALVLIAKQLRRVLMRDEDYYD